VYVEAITDLRHNRIGRSVDVCRSEPKHPKSRIDDQVLPLVISYEAVAVVCAVNGLS